MTSLLIVLLVVAVLAALTAPAVLVGRHRRPAPWSAQDRIGVAPDAFDDDRAAHAG
ncbi:MAG: hypothetical protein Q7T56_18145 [Nocardioidaceae bacterium]|nr:hypothetical protein [Nocardioidaceae bacterium]